jgi:hypothetical protein
MRTIVLDGTLKFMHRRVGQPGDHLEVSDGTTVLKIPIAEARDLADRIKADGSRLVDSFILEKECTLEGGERVLLNMNGAQANALKGAAYA